MCSKRMWWLFGRAEEAAQGSNFASLTLENTDGMYFVLVYSCFACGSGFWNLILSNGGKNYQNRMVFCHQNCFQIKKCSTYTSIYPNSTKRCFGISMCSKNSASWFSQNEILTRGSVKNWCYSTENPEIEWETIPWCKKYKQYIVNIKAFIYCICSMLYIHSIQYTVYCTYV